MLRYTLITVVIIVLPVASYAQDLPRLDPVEKCRREWTEGVTLNNRMYAYCLDREQAAYDSLKPVWQSFSANVRNICLHDWGSPTDGSYRMLQYCADQQRQAEQQNSSSTFRY